MLHKTVVLTFCLQVEYIRYLGMDKIYFFVDNGYMNWSDQAIILNTHKYSEHSAIVSAFTREHGRYKGMVRQIANKHNRGTFQLGNLAQLHWRARLSEHLGNYQGELTYPFAALCIHEPLPLIALSSLCSILEYTLPERDPHPELFDQLLHFLKILVSTHSVSWAPTYIEFELFLLQELGFRLELEKCAATGSTTELAYVSPKSGRAICKTAGLPYHKKLLPLPSFLIDSQTPISILDLEHGLALSAYFLNKYIFEAHHIKMPQDRLRFQQLIHQQQITCTTT